jgi:hypothetical protein
MGMKMKKTLIYFLCVSFLLMMGQFHSMIAEAKEKVLPVGEMVSKGVVKYEAKESVWRNVESSLFPVFPGMKIKTEKGNAAIVFSDGSQIEISPNSLFSVIQTGQIQLSQGSIEFRILSDSELNFKVGNLSVLKSRTLQASRTTTAAAPKSEETIGSISVHSNGAVTVKNIQGNLSILDENHVLLAGLSSKDSVTLPSTTVKTSPRTMTAQVGQTTGTTTTTTTGEFLGLSTWAWVGIGLAAVVATGIVIAVAQDDDDDDFVPICP